MGKQGKRQRKFQATGGVKGRLEKGTITKKGKVIRKRKRDDRKLTTNKSPYHHQDKSDSNNENATTSTRLADDDFTANNPKSLAGLNLDDFFAQASQDLEQEQQETNDDDIDNDEDVENNNDDDDDRQDDDEHDDDQGDSEDDDENDNRNQGKNKTKRKAENSISSKKQTRIKNLEEKPVSTNVGVDGADKTEVADKKRKTKHEDTSVSMSQKRNNNNKKKKKTLLRDENEIDEGSSSSSSDDDNEDVEMAEKRLKVQMAKLNQSDPEFHEFLQENENELLQFGQDDDDDDETSKKEDGEGSDDDDDDEEASRNRGSPDTVHLTLSELKKLETGVFNLYSIKSLKRLMTAYRCACHLADTTEDKGSRAGESGIRYMIDSSRVFDTLMVTCLTRCHEIFRHHLFSSSTKKTTPAKKKKKGNVPNPEGEEQEEVGDENDDKDNKNLDENKPISPNKLENSGRWQDMRRIMQSFFSSTLHLLSEAKDPELLTFVLKVLSKYMAFLSAFPRVAESIVKNLVEKWSSTSDSLEDFQVVRLNAFFRIRQLAITQPFPFIETCLRKTYLAYARRAKHGSSSTPTTDVLSTLTFMGNSVVELYSLDLHSSYQHAFVYIRQLALHLRSAIQKTASDAMQQIFRWQYMHCLKLWVAVLSNAVSQQDDDDDGGSGQIMRSLIYPLSEIIYGVARLAPSNVRHLPFRLHCVRLLQQLAASSEMFIPTTSLLLDCLDWKEWYMKPKKTSKKNTTVGLNLMHVLKLPKEDSLRTHEQLEVAIVELFVLLEREVDLYSYSAGFPEFCTWIRRRLKTFSRATRQPRWRKFADGILDLCNKHATHAILCRAKLQEAPKDVQQLECLKPVSTPSMKERHKALIDKEVNKHLVTTTTLSTAALGTMTGSQGEKVQGSKSTKNKTQNDNDEEDEEEMKEEESVGKKDDKKKRLGSIEKDDDATTTTTTTTTTKAKKRGKNQQQQQPSKMAAVVAVEDEANILQQEDDVHEGFDWCDEDE